MSLALLKFPYLPFQSNDEIMKYLLLFALCSVFATVKGQESHSWQGNFEGNFFGIGATISSTLNGRQWVATINVSGYPLQAEGTVNNDQCSGTMTDQSTKETTTFTARLSGNQITIQIRDINPVTGLEEDMQFVFDRTGDLESGDDFGVDPSLTDEIEHPSSKANATNIDRNLIGLWRYTDTYVSGQFSFATDYFMQMEGNGVIITTDGRTAGGGPTSSIVSGEPDTHEGEWKVEGKEIWARDGQSEWYRFAQYYREGNSLMLTYPNGKRQVWERIR